MKYSITCNCGHEVNGNDRRLVEAKAWHHAIHDHADMVNNMSVEQFTEIMKSWDKKFAQKK